MDAWQTGEDLGNKKPWGCQWSGVISIHLVGKALGLIQASENTKRALPECSKCQGNLLGVDGL